MIDNNKLIRPTEFLLTVINWMVYMRQRLVLLIVINWFGSLLLRKDFKSKVYIECFELEVLIHPSSL